LGLPSAGPILSLAARHPKEGTHARSPAASGAGQKKASGACGGRGGAVRRRKKNRDVQGINPQNLQNPLPLRAGCRCDARSAAWPWSNRRDSSSAAGEGAGAPVISPVFSPPVETTPEEMPCEAGCEAGAGETQLDSLLGLDSLARFHPLESPRGSPTTRRQDRGHLAELTSATPSGGVLTSGAIFLTVPARRSMSMSVVGSASEISKAANSMQERK